MNKSLKERLTARFRHNPLTGSWLNLTGKSVKPDQWVFIVGCYNSGTTLLHDVLALHPEIGAMNDEGVMLTDLLPRPEDFGWRRMWFQCESQINLPLDAKSADRIKRQWSHFLPNNKAVFLEKSISNTVRIPFFRQHFQPAKFIHIVRNGYAVAEGIYRKARVMPPHDEEFGSHYPLSLCAGQWSRSLELVNELKQVDMLEITYEDFTTNPEKILNCIFDFLNMFPINHSLYNHTFSIQGQTNPITNMNDASLNRLSYEDREIIERVAGPWLKRYGYQ